MLTEDVDGLSIPLRRRADGRTVMRAAEKLTVDYRDRLTVWYPRLAHLRARAMRSEFKMVRPEARALLLEVIQSRKQLAERTEAVSEAISSHSIVRDVQRAFERLEEQLCGLMA